MTRFSSALNAEATEQRHVRYVIFGDFYFISGHLRASTWDRNITWNGYTWLGASRLVGIEAIKESGDLRPTPLRFTLSGIDPTLLSSALTEAYQNREATLWLGFMTEQMELIDDPQIIWEGRMDQMLVHADTNEASISLICQNRLSLWNKACGWMLTHEYQRLINVNDNFFSLMTTLQNKVVKWGEKTV